MKAILCLAALILFHSSLIVGAKTNDNGMSDNSDGITAGMLVGNWTFESTQANNTDFCCIPTGNIEITGNTNGTVTVTSGNWTGSICSATESTILDPNGNNDLPDGNGGSNFTISIESTNSHETLTLTYNNLDDCTSTWSKGGASMTMAFASFVGLFIALFN